MMYKILKPIAWFLMKVLFLHKAVGAERVKIEGGCIFASNHMSLLDPVFLGLGVKNRIVHYMAKAEIFKGKLASCFFYSMGAFPVKRGSKDISAIKNAIDMIEKGHMVGIFPQGKRVKGEVLSRYKTGFALLAVRTGCPVVPVYVKTKHQRLRPFRRVTVIYGEPVSVEQLGYTDGTAENLQQMAQRLMAITEELAAQI